MEKQGSASVRIVLPFSLPGGLLDVRASPVDPMFPMVRVVSAGAKRIRQVKTRQVLLVDSGVGCRTGAEIAKSGIYPAVSVAYLAFGNVRGFVDTPTPRR